MVRHLLMDISAGHGITWEDGAWRTQRPNTNGIVEDMVSIEAVDQMLIPYLQAMGAYVVPEREPDLQREPARRSSRTPCTRSSCPTYAAYGTHSGVIEDSS